MRKRKKKNARTQLTLGERSPRRPHVTAMIGDGRRANRRREIQARILEDERIVAPPPRVTLLRRRRNAKRIVRRASAAAAAIGTKSGDVYPRPTGTACAGCARTDESGCYSATLLRCRASNQTRESRDCASRDARARRELTNVSAHVSVGELKGRESRGDLNDDKVYSRIVYLV